MATAAGRAHEPSWLEDDIWSIEDANGAIEHDTQGGAAEQRGQPSTVERSSFGLLGTTALSLAIFLPQLAWMVLLAYLALRSV